MSIDSARPTVSLELHFVDDDKPTDLGEALEEGFQMFHIRALQTAGAAPFHACSCEDCPNVQV